MTRALAHKEGLRFEETLTGFKWICNKKADLQKQGFKVLLAFEESIGFCCGDVVNDKEYKRWHSNLRASNCPPASAPPLATALLAAALLAASPAASPA
eukprot:1483593-Prymnesium_polylepis.1